MKRSRLTAVYLFIVFTSGLLVGGVGYRLYNAEVTAKAKTETQKRPTPEQWRKHYVDVMTRRLTLSDDQLVQLNAILDDTRQQFHALEEEVDAMKDPRAKAIRESQNAAILAMLDDPQRAEYEKLRRERAERRKRDREQKDGRSSRRHR